MILPFFLLLAKLSLSSDLKFVALVTRHGARAPKQTFSFNNDYWQQSQLAQLTPEGIRQQYLLGSEIGRRYVGSFLQSDYNPNEIFILSTSLSRTQQSAYSLMHGMYPEIRKKLKFNARPPMNISDIDLIENQLNLSAIMNNIQPFSIQVEQKGNERILHAYKEDTCPRMREIKQMLKQKEEYTSIEQFYSNSLFPKLSQATGEEITSIKKASNVVGALLCDLAHGYSLPQGLSEEGWKAAQEMRVVDQYYIPFRDLEARRLACDGFFKDLKQKMRGFKFALYSTHDIMIVGLLSCLEIPHQVAIPFSGNLLFEVYSNNTIDIRFNDRRINSNTLQFPCDIGEFEQKMQKYHTSNFDRDCQLTNKVI